MFTIYDLLILIYNFQNPLEIRNSKIKYRLYCIIIKIIPYISFNETYVQNKMYYDKYY